MPEQTIRSHSELDRKRAAIVTGCLGAGVLILFAVSFVKLRTHELAIRFAKEQQLPDTAKVVSTSWSKGKRAACY